MHISICIMSLATRYELSCQQSACILAATSVLKLRHASCTLYCTLWHIRASTVLCQCKQAKSISPAVALSPLPRPKCPPGRGTLRFLHYTSIVIQTTPQAGPKGNPKGAPHPASGSSSEALKADYAQRLKDTELQYQALITDLERRLEDVEAEKARFELQLASHLDGSSDEEEEGAEAARLRKQVSGVALAHSRSWCERVHSIFQGLKLNTFRKRGGCSLGRCIVDFACVIYVQPAIELRQS